MTILDVLLRTSVLAASFALAACGDESNSDTSGADPDPTTNAAPVISGAPPTLALAGETYMFLPSAHDPDGDTLTFSIRNRPGWATFSPLNGRFSGRPPASAAPLYEGIVISVTDGTDTVSLPAFDLTVDTSGQTPVNTAPAIGGSPATSVVAGTAYSFTPTSSDADGDMLVFSITRMPTWATFDATTGRLEGTTTASDAGNYSGIVISVTDGLETTALPSFNINVASEPAPNPVNQPPVISGTPSEVVTVGQAYSFRPTATDPDGQALTFSIANGPAWANFNSTTGRLSGTPTVAHIGQTSDIVISVTDGEASTSLPAFTLTVLAPPNGAPSISGTPPTSVTSGQAYSFTPTASDPDGQTLRFGIANRPSWATFDDVTGRLSGTPLAAGTTSNIVISVSDGTNSATLPAFSIQVVAANRSPVIGGTPPTSVTSGQAYSFTPTASDPDGDNLVFSVTGLPTWATFDNVSGRLYGTPGSAGTFSNIRITVSDGTTSAQLPAFSIQVVAAVPTGSATLRWTPPTLNEDGSPINNLAGYRIYYGTNSANLSNVLQVANPTATSAAVQSLSPATWYFAVRAYNSLGVESALSNIASKTIQ